MDFLWILVAFVFGLLARQLTMPPLTGFLLAGFVLNAMGVEPTNMLDELAGIGITLMLFTIGLKLDARALFRTDVWVTTITQAGSWLVIGLVLLPLPTMLGISQVFQVSIETAALIAFALSFSSTVAVVKILEEASELKVRHGRLALGILIIQDLLAVIFMVSATGEMPSPWAAALLLLPLSRPVIYWLAQRAGHGELLPLTGLFLALGGYELFHYVGIEGHLGALLFGMLLAGHNKASELYKTLMQFKDLFLIGFFLSVGFTALPTLDMVPIVIGLTLLLFLKFFLFFVVMIVLGVSGRASFLASLVLSNFSEFGLIVAQVGVNKEWLSSDWLVMIALAMSASFVISTLLYRYAHYFYARLNPIINRFERKNAHTTFNLPSNIDILVVGMGRVGKGAYLALQRKGHDDVWGLESDAQRVVLLKEKNVQVIAGDADDPEFWEHIARKKIGLVMLALPAHQEMLATLQMMKLAGYHGLVAAVARYEDEREELLTLGVDIAFNYYSEVGSGFAAECEELIVGDRLQKYNGA
ncbi:MAG: cation:proton antiporter [Oleibacter sp.]|nr:cation:proton antiporter [Thalassolituus sp.]